MDEFEFVTAGYNEKGSFALKKVYRLRPPHMSKLQFFFYRLKVLW